MRGLFITFEGGEGSGKTTQIEKLQERIKSLKYNVISIREPGETFLGKKIRELILSRDIGEISPITETLLFFAARKELINKIITPALSDGKIVLCDRFVDSTLAYQGNAKKVDFKLIEYIAKHVCGELHPDRTIFLDIPANKGIERANKRMAPEKSLNQTVLSIAYPDGKMVYEGHGESRFEDEPMEFHKLVREGFMDIAKHDHKRVKVINAQQSIEEVHEAVFKAVSDILPEI